jgi:hypothetical protein
MYDDEELSAVSIVECRIHCQFAISRACRLTPRPSQCTVLDKFSFCLPHRTLYNEDPLCYFMIDD